MYPNYVYRPQRTKERAKLKKATGRNGGAQNADTESYISSVFPVASPPIVSPLGRAFRVGGLFMHSHLCLHIRSSGFRASSCTHAPYNLPFSQDIPHLDHDHLRYCEYLAHASLYLPTFQQPVALERCR